MRHKEKYVEDILDAIGAIERFTQAETQESFEKNDMLVAAIERMIFIIGEAFSQLKKLDEDLVNSFSHSREIIGMRNILAHAYHDIDRGTLWGAANEGIAMLRIEISEKFSLTRNTFNEQTPKTRDFNKTQDSKSGRRGLDKVLSVNRFISCPQSSRSRDCPIAWIQVVSADTKSP